jgi:hypothetical protein
VSSFTVAPMAGTGTSMINFSIRDIKVAASVRRTRAWSRERSHPFSFVLFLFLVLVLVLGHSQSRERERE